AILVAALFAGCAATQPPPLPQNNPASSQLGSSSARPREVLVRDEVTLAIEKQLSPTEAEARSAETMKHDMNNIPGMQHGEMQGMQQGATEPEKKAVADEMKKTADAMKKTSAEMKRMSDEMKPGATIYTC